MYSRDEWSFIVIIAHIKNVLLDSLTGHLTSKFKWLQKSNNYCFENCIPRKKDKDSSALCDQGQQTHCKHSTIVRPSATRRCEKWSGMHRKTYTSGLNFKEMWQKELIKRDNLVLWKCLELEIYNLGLFHEDSISFCATFELSALSACISMHGWF